MLKKVRCNEEFVGFFGGVFSNFYKCDFELRGKRFVSSEQAFMYCKAKLFKDEEIAKMIINESNPAKCKKLGRKVRGFNEEIWNEKKERYMYLICLNKFSQNNMLRDKLIETDSKVIVECSPYDREWGIGISVDEMINGEKWKGKNKLGYVLMEVRKHLI